MNVLKAPDFSLARSLRIVQLILDADMRCRHDGLAKVAKDAGVDVDTLTDGQFVVYLNRKRNYLCLYGSRNLLASVRLKTGTIDVDTIRFIPGIFMAKGRLDYNDALRKALELKLPRRLYGKVGNLKAVN
jgi:hypothetical protein